jgi:hypothetical protein
MLKGVSFSASVSITDFLVGVSTGLDGQLRVWDLESGALKNTLNAEQGGTYSLLELC